MAKHFTSMNFFPFLAVGFIFFSGWVINLAGLATVQQFGWSNSVNPSSLSSYSLDTIVNASLAAYELQWSCLSWFRLFLAFVLFMGLIASELRKDLSAYRHMFATFFAIDFVLIVIDGAIRIRVLLHMQNNFDIMTLLGIAQTGVPASEQAFLAGLVVTGFGEFVYILMLQPDMRCSMAQFVWRDPSVEENDHRINTGGFGSQQNTMAKAPPVPGPSGSQSTMSSAAPAPSTTPAAVQASATSMTSGGV